MYKIHIKKLFAVCALVMGNLPAVLQVANLFVIEDAHTGGISIIHTQGSRAPQITKSGTDQSIESSELTATTGTMPAVFIPNSGITTYNTEQLF